MATVQYWIERLQRDFKPADNIAIALWQADDIRGLKNGDKLNDAGVNDVLENIERHHDPELGISWETLRCGIDEVIEDDEYLEDAYKKLRIIRVMVAGTNANGESDIFFCKVKCYQDEYNNGDHYMAAKRFCAENGYESPFVVFDEYDSAGKAMLSLFTWHTALIIEIEGDDHANI